MGADAGRVILSVRLDASDKTEFAAATESAGLEASVAARQLIELIVQRIRAGADYIDVLVALRGALGSLERTAPVEGGAQDRNARRTRL